MHSVNVQELQQRINTQRNNQDQELSPHQDTRGSINDDAAALYIEWRSLQEEGPPHVIFFQFWHRE